MTDFADALNQLTPDALRRLIALRPDVFFPPPPSLASLATRLTQPASTARALRALNAADLATLQSLVDAGAELSPTDPVPFGDTTRLRDAALVYDGGAAGSGELVRVAPGAVAPLPQAWRVADRPPADLDAKLAALDARQRKVIESLAAGGGIGLSKAAAPDADPTTPAARLVADGLLVRMDAHSVRLPEPVLLAFRGRTPRVHPLTAPPEPEADQTTVDRDATAAGLEAVRQARQLLTRLLRTPAPLNKDGSVGVRTLAALTKELGFDPGLTITVGEAAGLIGRGPVDDSRTGADDANALAATKDALSWLDAPISDQWAILLAGWLASPWRLDQGRLLSTESRQPDLRRTREVVARHGGDMEQLLFHAPLDTAGLRPEFVAQLAEEARTFGALAPNPSTPLRVLLARGDVAAATRELVPAEIDAVIAQADLTILAPGPLPPAMASMLESFAQLESPGLASVWRVSDASVRRALDAGRTADELKAWLEAHTLGEVPQGLGFLLDDVARTHGAVRAGSALSYLRSEDPAALTAAAQHAPLRILAPTVAVSQLPLPQLIARLRDAGLQPAAEDADGATIDLAPEPALVRATPATLARDYQIDEGRVEQLVGALTAGAKVASTNDKEAPAEVLRAAARGRRHVRVTYFSGAGEQRQLAALPLSVREGRADLLDEATDKVVRLPIARVAGVELA